MTQRYDPIVRSFNAGEWTEMLAERSDLEKYHSACSVLENMIVTPHGPVQKTPGTYYVATVKDTKARLIPFQYNTSDTMILEVGPGYVRFFKNDRPVYLNAAITTWAAGTHYSIADVVHDSSTGAPWLCVKDHVSSDTFANDSDYWYQQSFAVTVSSCDLSESPDNAGCVRVSKSDSFPPVYWWFKTVRPGDFVYFVDATSEHPSGFYLVLGRDAAANSWIDLDLAYSDDKTAQITVSQVTYQIPIDIQDPSKIQYVQSNDVISMDHPDHFPSKLMRFSEFHWEYREKEYNDGPFLDEETEGKIDNVYVCPNFGVNVSTGVPSDSSGYILITKAGEFANHVVGQIVYCEFSEARFADGAYKVLAQAANTIKINLAWSSGTAGTVDVYPVVRIVSGGAMGVLKASGATGVDYDTLFTDGDKVIKAVDATRYNYIDLDDKCDPTSFGSTSDGVFLDVTASEDGGTGKVKLSATGIETGISTDDEDEVVVTWNPTFQTGLVLRRLADGSLGLKDPVSGSMGYLASGDIIYVEIPTCPEYNKQYKIGVRGAGEQVIGLTDKDTGAIIPWNTIRFGVVGLSTDTTIAAQIHHPYGDGSYKVVSTASNEIIIDLDWIGPAWNDETPTTNAHTVNTGVDPGVVYLKEVDSAATVLTDGGTHIKITCAGTLPDAFEIGSFVYLNFTATYTDGWYAITGINRSDKWFTVDVTYSADTTAHVIMSAVQADLDVIISMKPSATVGTITIDAGADYFVDTMKDSLILLDQYRPAVSAKVELAAAGTSSELLVVGSWEIYTAGSTTDIWTLTLERRANLKDAWEPIKTYCRHGENLIDSGDELEMSAWYRFTLSNVTGTPKIILSSNTNKISGIARISEVLSPTRVKAKVLHPFYSTDSTIHWRMGAFSQWAGFPSCITMFEDRECHACTKKRPNAIYLSRVGDYENFYAGGNADDSMIIELNTATNDKIQWIIGKTRLFIGTAGGEHTLSGANDEPTTIENMRRGDPSTYGSRDIQPVLAGDTILYVQRQGKKIREIVYSLESDDYVANDLSILAPQVSESGIIGMAYMQMPFPILWCWMADGTLAGMSYERAQRVAAWHRQPTDGEYKSVAVINGEDDDKMWAIVERDAGTFIERFGSFDIVDDIEDQYFVHCGMKLDFGDAVDVTVTVNANSVQLTIPTFPENSLGESMCIGCSLRLTGLATRYSRLDYAQTGAKWVLGALSGGKYYLNDENNVQYDPSVDSVPTGTSTSISMEWGIWQAYPEHIVLSGAKWFLDGEGYYDYFSNQLANTFVYGLPYTAKVAPMPFNVDFSGGTIRNKQRRVVALAASLFRSGVCKYGYDLDKLEEPDIDDDELFTGMIDKTLGGVHTKDPVMYVVSEEPRQLVVRAIVPQFDIGED